VKLGFFNLKVYIGHPFILEAHAGESDDQAESPTDSFAVTADARSAILEEILLKLAAALHVGAETIDLDVNVSAKEILRDPTFPLPAPTPLVRAAALGFAARATPAMAKAAVRKATPKAAAMKAAKGKAADKKSAKGKAAAKKATKGKAATKKAAKGKAAAEKMSKTKSSKSKARNRSAKKS
jgi:hypothetical protein